MMKWIILAGSAVLMAGCCCTPMTTTMVTPVVAYKPVVTYKPVVSYRTVSHCGTVIKCVPTYAVSPVVEPVMIQPYENGPWDVTTTTIDFY